MRLVILMGIWEQPKLDIALKKERVPYYLRGKQHITQISFEVDQQDENFPTCHAALQLVRLAAADDESAALSIEEKTEELDLAVHVAVQ